VLLTPRLGLRRWEPRDSAPFAALNADPEVMRHFPAPLDSGQSDALIERFERAWNADGVSFAVAERRSDGAFLGMVGLNRLRLPEIGPRLDRARLSHLRRCGNRRDRRAGESCLAGGDAPARNAARPREELRAPEPPRRPPPPLPSPLCHRPAQRRGVTEAMRQLQGSVPVFCVLLSCARHKQTLHRR